MLTGLPPYYALSKYNFIRSYYKHFKNSFLIFRNELLENILSEPLNLPDELSHTAKSLL